MTAIPVGPSIPWYRIPLPAERREALSRRSDLLGLAQSLGYLAVFCSTGGLAVWAAVGHHWWILAAALVAHGNVSGFMINAVHELVHGTVFRSRWLNLVFVHLFAFLGWINHRMFWASHTEHHLHTMHFPYDQENVFPIRYRLIDFLREATCNPAALSGMIGYHWRIGHGRLTGDWEKHLLEGRPRHAAVAAWSRWLLIGHAAIAGIALAHGLWIIPIVLSLTPLYCKGLFWLLNNAQHVGLVESVADFRLNSRTIVVNPVFRFLYWHMNWHIEHHMFPAVPCYRLAALHRAIEHELPPSPRGLLATWEHIVDVMRRQRREPGWAFRAELPARLPTYRWIADWAKIDSGSGHAHHGIVVARDGTILTGHATDSIVQRLDCDGKLLGSFPVPAGETHCLALGRPDGPETLWIADIEGHEGGPPRVIQVDQQGRLLAQLTKAELGYASGEDFQPTAVAVDPISGDVWIADGYGSSRVHVLGPDLKRRLTLDGTTGAGRFSCPHWVWIDRRSGESRIYVADRSNDRIQVFDRHGTFIKVLRDGLVTPSGLTGFADFLVVAELHARVVILDRDDRIVAVLGAGTTHVAKPGWPNRTGADGAVTPPHGDIPDGQFNSPHGIAADAAGNLYVSEWLLGDRFIKLTAAA